MDVDPACALCEGNLGSAIADSDTGPERLDEAEAHLRRAIALRPDNPIPFFNLGGLLMAQKRYDEAEAAFRRYNDLGQNADRGIGRLGVLYLLRGRYADAIPLLEQARGIRDRHPPTPDAPATALAFRAVELVQDDPGTLVLVGRELVEQGHPMPAAMALARASGLAPASVPAHFWLVRAYRDAGKVDLARQELATLNRINPSAAARLTVD